MKKRAKEKNPDPVEATMMQCFRTNKLRLFILPWVVFKTILFQQVGVVILDYC